MSSEPLTHDDAVRVAQPALELSGADGVEVVLSASKSGLTRFAGSQIIQNTAQTDLRASIRVVTGGRVATASTNQLHADHMRAAAARALEAARASIVDLGFPGLPDGSVGRPEPFLKWDEPTASASPSDRAASVREVVAAAGGEAAGFYETGAHAFAVLSSTGIDCFDAYTRCVLKCLVEIDGATGWAEDGAHSRGLIDIGATACSAAAKAAAGRNATPAEPGTYEVVLEPPAVATLLEYLSYAGMGAKQVIEGESFLAARMGEMVAAPFITIADDAGHPQSLGIAFDFEGSPRRRVEVIRGGRAVGPVTDWRTARQMGAAVSGHYSGLPSYGPYASNVVMESGDASFGALVGDTQDGLLVSRFHYVNVLDRPSTLLTGMTRDGTFRIRAGEVAEPVLNFRFSQSVLDALATAVAVGSHARSFAGEVGSFGSTVAPPLRIGEFRFSSRTSH